jgi:hypothetical protein
VVSRLTRRSFLIGAATAATAAAAACSKGSGVITVPNNAATDLNLLLSSGAGDGPNQQAISVFEGGMDQRVAFVLVGKSGPLSPAPGSVSLQVSGDDKSWGPALPVDIHSDTGAQATTYGTVTYRFAKPGTYFLRASYQGKSAESPVAVIDAATAMIPYAGQKMISTATPTNGDHRGVDPICTRTPACPFHSQSLDAALATHLPIALLFATPALCTSATCGPVLDNLVAAAPAYAGRINFVHSEIFVSLSRDVANTPAVLAYHLQSEPLLFLADATGTVVERIDGLFGKTEVTTALAKLAAPAA